METKEDIKRILLNTFIIFLISRLLLFITYIIYVNVFKDAAGFEAILGRWDASYYVDIVKNGYSLPKDYNAQINLAFFPLYPMVCKVFDILTFSKNTFLVCVIVSNVFIYFASVISYKYLLFYRKYKKENIFGKSYTIVWLLMLAPFTIYFATAYTESMFVFFVVATFYLLKKEKFLFAAILIILATLTRSLGIALIIPLIMKMYSSYKKENKKEIFVIHILKEPIKLFSIIISPMGIFLFSLYMYYFFGDALAFKNVQVAWRSEKMFPVFGVLYNACVGNLEKRYIILGFICIATLIFYIFFIKKYPLEATFGIITLLIPLTSHVISTQRFISGSFVFWFLFSIYLSSKTKKHYNISMILISILGLVTAGLWYAWSPFMM